MKKYIKPTVEVISINTTAFLAASQTLSVSNETFSGGFNGHEDDGDWEDE